MSAWKILENLLREARMYRGETSVRMKDLRSLFKTLVEMGASSDPVVKGEPDPQGGAVTCSYPVDPRSWGRWSPSIDVAKVFGGTDKQDTQHRGQPQGGTVMKRNYGGRVVYQPGPTSRDHERLPSAMDRYDVLMVADVEGAQEGVPLNWPPHQKVGMPKIVVRRIAWSPAMGSADERQARLQALISGQRAAPLARRPQPEVPEPTPKMSDNPAAQPVPRVGQNLKRRED